MRDGLGVLHLLPAGVDQRGDHPHRHVAAGAGGVAGGQHLDPEAGATGSLLQARDHLVGDGAEAVGPLFAALVGADHRLQALLVHLLPGGEEAVVLATEVAVEGGAVEARPVEHRLDRGFAVAALGSDLDHGFDDQGALGAAGLLADLRVQHH